MSRALEAGFIFWGLFLVFALMVLLYITWMRWVEGRASRGSDPELRERGGDSQDPPWGGEP